MPIELITGPANAGKARLVLGATRARAARGEEPLLVVPTEADQARYRRELVEGGLTLAARVERFDGLIVEAIERSGISSTPIGSLARERLIARIAGARPGLSRALAQLVADLQAQRVTPARLRRALRAWESFTSAPERSEQLELFGEGSDAGRGERATLERLCAIYERYQAALHSMRRVDREQRAIMALDALRRQPTLWGATPVLLYGFDDLTELQLDAIETLGDVVGAQVTVSLTYEPGRVALAGRAASFQRLAPLAASHTQLEARADYYAPVAREALHHLERSLLSGSPTRVLPGRAVVLLEGESPRAELELVAAEVRALLDEGVPAQEIAIVHRSPQAIFAAMGEALDALDVPHAGSRRFAFADTAVGRALLGLLRCALQTGGLPDLLAWLRSPGVLERPELADRLEARALRAGALSAEQARALWESERWPLDRLDRLRDAALAGTPALADALVAELERLFEAPHRASAALLDERELDEARGLAVARRALEELRDTARLSPGFASSPGELIEALERLDPISDAHQAGASVALVDPLSLRARRVRMLFVCGMQEGTFPAPPSPLLIAEQERRALARASGLALRAAPDTLAAERYLLYALVSRPEERLTLSWHSAAEDGAPLARSLFVDDVCDLFDRGLTEHIRRHPAAGVGEPALVASGPPERSRGGAHGQLAGVPEAMPDPPRAPIQPLSDERVLARLRERRLWSASSLELWAGCPVKWFVERLLRGRELGPDPEPLARGGLAHAALKATLERLRERTGSARLTHSTLPLAKRLLGEQLDELRAAHPLSVAPERLPGARRRLQVDLERYLECASEQSSPLEPTHLEMEFGFENGLPGSGFENGLPGPGFGGGLPPLDLGEGVLLRGRIDRVDVGPKGEAIVYDYKGRSAPPGARWLEDRAWQIGLYMRAVERLLDARPVGGFYQPLAGSEIKPRGILDGESGLELECVRTDRIERDELERIVEGCVAAAREAAHRARSGALRPQPDTCAYGGGCSYPTICRCER
jgi:ATP-dependent helicase/DNAse subunit B